MADYNHPAPTGGVEVGGAGVGYSGHLALIYNHPAPTGGVMVGGGYGACPLFIRGYDSDFDSLNLFLAGHDSASGGLTLAMPGVYGSASGSSPLFIEGQKPSGVLTLFSQGVSASSGGFTLFESAIGAASGEMSLYETGYEPASGSMNLFLKAEDVPVSTGSLNLMVGGHAFGGSGMFGGLDLITFSDASGNLQNRSMPLFLRAVDTDSTVKHMNLWVGGCAFTDEASIDLFLLNEQSGVNSAMTLVMSGEGSNPGWSPTSTSMNLFLSRNPGDAITLYTQGPGTPSSSGVSLFLKGGAPVSGVLSLSLADVVGYGSGAVKLYCIGW